MEMRGKKVEVEEEWIVKWKHNWYNGALKKDSEGKDLFLGK
jgi:hypothetical protein